MSTGDLSWQRRLLTGFSVGYPGKLLWLSAALLNLSDWRECAVYSVIHAWWLIGRSERRGFNWAYPSLNAFLRNSLNEPPFRPFLLFPCRPTIKDTLLYFYEFDKLHPGTLLQNKRKRNEMKFRSATFEYLRRLNDSVSTQRDRSSRWIVPMLREDRINYEVESLEESCETWTFSSHSFLLHLRFAFLSSTSLIRSHKMTTTSPIPLKIVIVGKSRLLQIRNDQVKK